MNTSILLNIPADGPVILPLEPLRRAGFVPGDQIILSIAAPGHLYLHKADVLPTGPDLKNSLRRLIQSAFEQRGIGEFICDQSDNSLGDQGIRY